MSMENIKVISRLTSRQPLKDETIQSVIEDMTVFNEEEIRMVRNMVVLIYDKMRPDPEGHMPDVEMKNMQMVTAYIDRLLYLRGCRV